MFRRAAVPSSALRALRALIAPASTAAQNKQPKNLQNGCCTNAYRAKTLLPAPSMTRQVFDILLNYYTFSMLFGLAIGTYSRWRNSDQFVMLFGPTSGFLWGDFGKTLQDWANLQNNIFWVVVVGLLVSVLANTLPSLLRGSARTQPTIQLEDSNPVKVPQSDA